MEHPKMVGHIPDPNLLSTFGPIPSRHEVFYVSDKEEKSSLVLAVARGDLNLLEQHLTKENLDTELANVNLALYEANKKQDVVMLGHILNISRFQDWRPINIRTLNYSDDGSRISSIETQGFPDAIYQSMIKANNAEILELYIHYGLDIDTHGLLSLSADTPNCMALLLSRGLDPNRTNYDGRSILSEQAQRGNTTAMMLLLEHGAKTTDSLFFASHHRQHEAMKVLLQHGAEANEHHLFDRGRSCRNYRSDPVNYDNKTEGLYDAGTALHAAATMARHSLEEWDIHAGSAETVQILVSHGALLTEVNGKGETPFDIAKHNAKYLGQKMVEMLRP